MPCVLSGCGTPDALPVGASTRYRLGLLMNPAPAVKAKVSPNQTRWYIIPLTNLAAQGVDVVQCPSVPCPLKDTPSPCSPPTSNVYDEATRLTIPPGLW